MTSGVHSKAGNAGRRSGKAFFRHDLRSNEKFHNCSEQYKMTEKTPCRETHSILCVSGRAF